MKVLVQSTSEFITHLCWPLVRLDVLFCLIQNQHLEEFLHWSGNLALNISTSRLVDGDGDKCDASKIVPM